jgi:site-specific DNA-cytosine methylase
MTQPVALGYLVGSGSMTLGVESGGFKVTELWETPGYGKNARSWQLNRPDLPINVLPLDFTSEHFAQPRYLNNLDMIYGNPPCGGLSSMTCSRIESPTNSCMRQWIRMVVKARPKTILMENAYQLATPRVEPLLTDLTNVLDDAGYWWWTWRFFSYQIGCPQVRQRMFLCASLTEPDPRLVSLDDLPPPRRPKQPYPMGTTTVKDVLWDLQGVEPSPDPVITKTGNRVTQHWYRQWDYEQHAEWIRDNFHKIGKKFALTREIERYKDRMVNGETEAIRRAAKNNYERFKDHIDDTRPTGLTGLCCTRPHVIRWDTGPAPTVLGFFRMVHPIDKRLLTMRELARLMGYPDSWQFHQYAPHLIAQGIPVQNAEWASKRLWNATENRKK